MGFADAVTGRLFLARRRSDLESQIQFIMQRKMAVLDQCNELSAELANSIYHNGETGTISDGAALPGFPGTNPVIGNQYIPTSELGSNQYEAQLAQLQGVEKELDMRQKKMETELEAVKAEEESMKKIASDRAKNDFKIG